MGKRNQLGCVITPQVSDGPVWQALWSGCSTMTGTFSTSWLTRPSRAIHSRRKEFGKYADGDPFVLRAGATAKANSGELNALIPSRPPSAAAGLLVATGLVSRKDDIMDPSCGGRLVPRGTHPIRGEPSQCRRAAGNEEGRDPHRGSPAAADCSGIGHPPTQQPPPSPWRAPLQPARTANDLSLTGSRVELVLGGERVPLSRRGRGVAGRPDRKRVA
jgi:hypothetical protein